MSNAPEHSAQIDLPPPEDLVPREYHAVMDCNFCEHDKINDPENIKAWLEDVSNSCFAGVKVMDPVVIKTNVGDTKKESYTAVQISHAGLIAARFVLSENHIYLDVTSGYEFNHTVIEESLKRFFGSGVSIKKILIPRNASAASPPMGGGKTPPMQRPTLPA